MADYRLKSYDASIPGMWEYDKLDRFGSLAVADLESFTTTTELYNQSLKNIQAFAEQVASSSSAQEISQDQSLGIFNDGFMTGVPHAYDGIHEERLIARSLAPEPEETIRTPFSLNVFPKEYNQIDDILVIEKDIVSSSTHSVLTVGGGSSNKEITGPTLTYRINFENPTEVNYISFFAAVPTRVLNITYQSAGVTTAIVADTQVFGAENIYFAPATIQHIDIIVNQPLRIFDGISKYVFALTKLDIGLNLYPENWTWSSHDFSFIEDIYSVEIYASQTNTTANPLPSAPNSINYKIDADKDYHIARRDNKIIELSTNPASDRQLIKCTVIPGVAGNRLFLPVRADVIAVYENGEQLPPTVKFVGTGLNDMSIGNNYSASTTPNYKVTATATSTYSYSDDGGITTIASGVAMTGVEQTLDNGQTITFAAASGHTATDAWYITQDVRGHFIHNEYIDFREGFEYFADVAFTNNESSYIIYPEGNRATVFADFSSYIGDRKTPAIIEELWVRIRLKRDTHLF